MEADSARGEGIRTIPLPAGPCWRTAALDLSQGVGSRHPRGGQELRAGQPQGLSRLVLVPGEVTQAGGAVADAVAMQDTEYEIAYGCHGLRSDPAADTAGVLAKSDVPHVVQLVLDGPVHAAQAEQ